MGAFNNVDFEHLYTDAITEMLHAAPNCPENIPSLTDLIEAIRQGADFEKEASTFETFFNWWDTFTAYDQLDEGISAADHKPILKVAYYALKNTIPAPPCTRTLHAG